MSHTLVVAEIGANHNGDYDTALRLIKAAKDAGADAVKFQLVTAEGLCHPTHAAYETVKKYALPREWMPCLMEYSRHLGIQCSATPCDFEAVDLLDRLDAPFLKIASGDLTYHALIQHAAKTGRHLIISTGAATQEEIETVWQMVATLWKRSGITLHGESLEGRLTLLHCTMEYPCPIQNADLQRLNFAINYPHLGDGGGMWGFSDHTLSLTLPAVAVGMGATVIEKHFTLSRNQDGPDHPHSLEPDEFRQMVGAIREAELALDDVQKQPLPEEQEMRVVARRGLYLRRDLSAGEVIGAGDVVAVRPCTHIGADECANVVGQRLTRSVTIGEALKWDMLDS